MTRAPNIIAAVVAIGALIAPVDTDGALAGEASSPAAVPSASPDVSAAPGTTSAIGQDAAKQTPSAGALRGKFAGPAATEADEQSAKELAALNAFYEARNYAALWFGETGLNAKGADLVKAIETADDYGLEAADFALPPREGAFDPDRIASAELMLSKAALLYARYARGGRIMKPAEMLNSNLDRKPQLLEPKSVLDGLAGSDTPGAYLVSLNPKHPQFEKLRQAFLAARGVKDGEPRSESERPLNANAKRLRANMEMWRWMYDDMGELHVLNNIPEFMQRVYRNGEVIRYEKIVAGMVDKQSSVFSRPLKHVVLRPKWRVPESIKVNELWPSLLKGGGLMRQYDLQLETKDGKPLDYKKIDWTKDDIRNYEVTQAPGGKSVLGVVKFSFPSQHTIYMHDTPDRWMFRPAQRTLSHGCLRVQKPVELAEIILDYDKGYDKSKVAEMIRSGPLNNEIEMEKRVPIHLVYFTSWVEDSGKVRAFADVYGHERRVILALDKAWEKIDHGRDHLAKVEPNFNPKAVAARAPPQTQQSRRGQAASTGDLISDALGLGF